MRSFKDWKIRSKLISITLILVLLPFLWTAVYSVSKFSASLREAVESDLDHIVTGLHDLCRAQQELLQQKVDKDLNVAHSVLSGHGEIRVLEDRSVPMTAQNQFEPRPEGILQVPAWIAGQQPITGNFAVVDEVRRLVGGTCTIFQIVDGDKLLRTSTNVQRDDGSRAIGTYIPASSDVSRSILAGKSYRGRAYVVNDWYITAYDPIRDAQGRVIGALYVGIQEKEAPSLRKAISDIRVGQTGYAYVMDSSGTLIFHPAKEGENIIHWRDTNGVEFIRQMCESALLLAQGQVGTIRYPWINPELGETRSRYKITKYQYFRDWDWIIVAGSYEEEIFGAIESTKRHIWIVAAMSLALVLFLTLMISRVLTNPIQQLTRVSARMAKGDLSQRVEIDRADEIGRLSASFNRMAGQVKDYTENLTRMVEQRTKELAESREKYRDLSNMLNNILQASTEYSIIATDLEGGILEYNTGSANIFGWEVNEVVGGQNIRITFPDETSWQKRLQEIVTIEESASGEFEGSRQRKDGETFPAHSVVTALRDHHGKHIGFLEISRDMTEKRRLEQELQETRDYLSSIVESSVDVIITTDQKGIVTFANRAIEQVLGFAREDLVGTHISRVYTRGIDRAKEIMAELTEKGSIQAYEMELFKADGSRIPIMTSAALLKDSEGRSIGTVGIFTDITERKKLEAELQKTQQSLIQAEKIKAIGDLVSGVAHEINNPLMASEAILHVMGDELQENYPSSNRHVRLLEQCNERISNIVRHLRDFSRESDMQFRSISINEPVEGALLITQQQLLNHNVGVVRNLAGELPGIMGDSNQLEQVFLNLISNAREAMEGVHRDKILTITTMELNRNGVRMVAAEVTDTGVGMPDEIKDKIFTPFFTTKEVGRGTGLGLSICYGIIESHDGKMEVESLPGEGTTFRVLIPARDQ